MPLAPTPTRIRALGMAQRLSLWLAAAALLATFIACVSTPPVHRKIAFNSKALETNLVRGVSTEADVRKALGEPFGRGAFLWPGSDAPREVLYYEKAEIGQVSNHLVLNEDVFLVFLSEGRFDGFFWFSD